MPLYRYECPACLQGRDEFNTVANRRKGPVCCGKPGQLVIMPSMIQADLPGYQSPVTGKWIEGRAARRDDLARHHCRPWEGKEAEVKEVARQSAHEERQSDEKLDAAARSAFSQLSPQKREILRNAGPTD